MRDDVVQVSAVLHVQRDQPRRVRKGIQANVGCASNPADGRGSLLIDGSTRGFTYLLPPFYSYRCGYSIQALGPFTYQQNSTKFDVRWTDNNTIIRFKYDRYFHLLSESGGRTLGLGSETLTPSRDADRWGTSFPTRAPPPPPPLPLMQLMRLLQLI